MTTMTQITSRPVERLHGRVRVPGDKSISHRAAMFGAVAEGVTEVHGFLNSLDCRATLAAIEALGVRVEADWRGASGELRIYGVGPGGFRPPAGGEVVLDLGNSGTSLRLMSGLLCGQGFAATLTGDESLQRRPMRRVTEPLARMGADVVTEPNGTPPVRIRPVAKLHGVEYRLPVASAQVKSCLLLATLFADGETVLVEETPTRDHTEIMLGAFGAPVSAERGRVTLVGGAPLAATVLDVPGDLSSAAFLTVAASLVPGSELRIECVGVNPTRTGVLEILKRMGANVELAGLRSWNGEPVADLHVRFAPLHGITVPQALVANAIDEFPVLFVAAACADGVTELSGASELRVKESDRIGAMAEGLAACGVAVEEKADGITICGNGVIGGQVDSRGDHRVAMSFAVAGCASECGVTVAGCENVDTSFPGFAQTAGEAGFDLEVV